MDLPLLLFQSLILCFLFLLFKSFTHNPTKPSKLRLPPGPWKLPIIGSIHHLAGGLPHRRLHRLSLAHGPVLHLKLGEIHHIVASTAAAAHEILKTHDLAFASRPALAAIKTVAYDCAGMGFSPYGPYWRQLRKICAVELLSTKRVKSFAPIRRDEAAKAVGEIHRRGLRSSTVNMSEVFLGLTNNYLTRAAFGKECRSRERFLRAMKETIKLAPVVSLVDLFPSAAAVISMFDGKMKRMRKLHVEMDAILNEIIEEHGESRGGGDKEREEVEKEDLVDVLMRVQESGELEIPLKMLHIKAVILDMLVAATETTSSTLVWVMTELIRHPEIMNKVQLEIREARTGKKTMEESDLDDFHYLKRVIKETLRLHPPLPLLLPRTCSETVKLSGFTVPGGSRVMVNAWAIGRDPEIWVAPDSFIPNRFEESSIDFKSSGNFSYIPFGGGRRVCPGMTFAMSGLELFLAELLLRFDWSLPVGMGLEELDMEEEFDGSLRKKNDLCLIATPWAV